MQFWGRTGWITIPQRLKRGKSFPCPTRIATYPEDFFMWWIFFQSNQSVQHNQFHIVITFLDNQFDVARCCRLVAKIKRRASIKWQDTKRVISRSKNSESIKFENMTIDAMTILGEGSAELWLVTMTNRIAEELRSAVFLHQKIKTVTLQQIETVILQH